MAERKRAKKGTQKSAKSTTAIDKKSKGFTDEERAAMKERAQELKEETRRGPRADKAGGEGDVLAKIAAMPGPDRAMAERLHAIIKASAPALSPKTWYGMPALPRFIAGAAKRQSRCEGARGRPSDGGGVEMGSRRAAVSPAAVGALVLGADEFSTRERSILP
jgi:hypothetical protein